MAYVKQNFTDGQTLTASHLNHIEDGLVALENELIDAGKKFDALEAQINGTIIPATVEE
jgi:hypothetical protein